MARIRSFPDDRSFETEPGESLLAAGLRAGLGFAHACGGRARCSTCRVSVLEGDCPPPTAVETAMAERLSFPPNIRLACQLRPEADLTIRRLVLDETDLVLCSQLDRAVASRAGDARNIAVFFSDIRNFTAISRRLSPYDVMYLLNRYFVELGEIVERHGGFVDKFVGDGAMALFGLDDQPNAPLRAVAAGLEVQEAVDRMKPYFAEMYKADFDIRIGLHWGEAVIGSVGSIGNERVTAIGDVVNIASRIEQENKTAGTRMLISEALYAQVEDAVEMRDFIRVRLEGTAERMTLYEIEGLTPTGTERLAEASRRETMQRGGRSWSRFFPADDLPEGRWRILRLEEFDLVVARRDGVFHAFNNACPHLRLPFFDPRTAQEGTMEYGEPAEGFPPPYSTYTEDMGVVCRWHRGCFDLSDGAVRTWAPVLAEDGTSPGMEHVGDISKNRCPLQVYPTRVIDGDLWIALG